MLDRVLPERPGSGAVLTPMAALWLVLAVTGRGAPLAHADVVYQWTDQRGVVHFSDVPPEAAPNVRQRELPAPPPAPTAAATPASTPGGTAAGPTGAAEPARVVLAAQQTSRVAPDAVRVVGTVRNEGDAPARAVTVALSANDVGQNNPCLERRLAVQPEELAPHESGTFDAVVESPCLFGDPPVQLQPTWE